MPDTLLSPQEQLLARLSEERTAEALHHLLDRLDVIAFTVDALNGFLGRANEVADSVAEGMQDLRKTVGADETASMLGKLPAMARTGVQLADMAQTPAVQRIMQSGVVEKLGDPATIENVKLLIERLELAVFTLEALQGFLARGDEIAESLAGGVADMRGAIPDIDPVQLRRTLAALPTLVEAGNVLVKSGMLDADIVGTLGEIGHVFASSYQEAKVKHPQSLGLFGLLRALQDPDVNRALNFGIRFAKAYGQSIK